ncbi:MAG: hypothetical protein R3C01_18120 [Planctomycetaceae bacterium]
MCALLSDAMRRREISPKEEEQRCKDGIRAFWDDFVSKSVDGTMRWTTFQRPPKYDPSKQTIVATREISPSVAEVETHDTRRDRRFIYVLVKEEESGRFNGNSGSTSMIIGTMYRYSFERWSVLYRLLQHY